MESKMHLPISIATDPLGHGVADAPLYLTIDVIADVAATVGCAPAETGGILLGQGDRDGVDAFEFDVAGSAIASSTVYTPDQSWALSRQEFWISNKNQHVLDGFVHSHPAGFPNPSAAAGGPNGDLGFAAAALAQNDHMLRFLLPIVTGVTTRELVLWPWVVERKFPDIARLARVIVCAPSQFPARRFPAALAHAIGGEPELPESPLVFLDVDQICRVLGRPLARQGGCLLAAASGVRACLTLPAAFPRVPPQVVVTDRTGKTHIMPIAWRQSSRIALEVRIAHVIRRALLCGKES
jgi:hypothetical protein